MTLHPPLLDLQHVTVLRDGRPVLDDLSLRIGAGECVAILGPNGAGKSTLLKLLTRECYPVPSERTVCRIMGRERWNVAQLRTQLGIVTNDLAASFELGVCARDVVLGGFFSSLSIEATHAVTDAMRATAAGTLARLGATALAERDVRTLSSGEARRVTIARALVHEPHALVFDEPCTSLDLAAQRDLRAAMRSLARDGVGVVLVTHDLAEIVPEIDRVVLLGRGGRIVADGPKRQILTAEALSALFGVEVELSESDGTYHAR